jgi:hypothetical protein
MFPIRPTFFASYRDVSDALLSSKMRIGTDFMHDFLRMRGIILSSSTSRDELIETIATYAYDSRDLDEICDQLEIHSKADRVTYTTLGKEISADDLSVALEAVKIQRNGRYEIIDFDYVEGDRLTVSVNYYDTDESRTVLRQQRPKEGKIEFMKVGAGMRVRYPGAERVTGLAKMLLNEIEKATGALDQTLVDLGAFDKLQRTLFFKSLISKLDGYRISDVRRVNVHKDIAGAVFSDDSEPDLSEEEEEEEISVAADDQADKKTVEREVKAVLKRASLDGSGILQAHELRRFLDSGFFISRIIWVVQPKSKKEARPKVEVEALLENPAEGTGFKYAVRGVYGQKRDKSYASTKRKAKDIEREHILDLVEKAAQEAYLGVVKSINEKATGNGQD